MYRPALITGIIACGLAVALGAFGAHGLQQRVPDPKYITIWEKGATYQFYHGFALLFAGMLYGSYPFASLRWATLLFGLGILLFSGSLYAITALATNGKSIGAGGIVTPIGGLCFIAGWICMLAGILAKK